MENFKDVFEAVFKRYNAKDYFMTKQTIRNKLLYAKQNNITVKYSEVKKYILAFLFPLVIANRGEDRL